MAIDFKFPDVGEGIHEAKIVEWLVQEGELVEMDQPFVRVETDKAIVELPVPEKAHIKKLHFKKGEIIKVGDIMVTFSPTASNSGKTVDSPKKAESPKAKKPVSPKKPSRKILATPHTRAMARKLGVEISSITPSGKGGRITDDDVENAAKSVPDTGHETVIQSIPSSGSEQVVVSDVSMHEETRNGAVERIPVSHLRKVIAENMIRSKQVSAHVTHVDEADVTDLYALYKKVKNRLSEEEDIKFTILPLFVKAVVTALKTHPYLNATYDEEKQEIVLKKYYNIGIATDTAEGLIVPVMKHADRKDIVTIARQISDLAIRSRERKITLEELRGSTFTITNVGSIGGVFATPIIHQPEIAILGLHAMKDRPVVIDGNIVIRKMMYMSLSFDHRFVDGAMAARFMSDLVELVENPDILMMRLV